MANKGKLKCSGNIRICDGPHATELCRPCINTLCKSGRRLKVLELFRTIDYAVLIGAKFDLH
jgi:hypothetical protein